MSCDELRVTLDLSIDDWGLLDACLNYVLLHTRHSAEEAGISLIEPDQAMLRCIERLSENSRRQRESAHKGIDGAIVQPSLDRILDRFRTLVGMMAYLQAAFVPRLRAK